MPYREALIRHLTSDNIGTGIHYPVPLHMQEAYQHLGYKAGDFPVSEALAPEILSLPSSRNSSSTARSASLRAWCGLPRVALKRAGPRWPEPQWHRSATMAEFRADRVATLYLASPIRRIIGKADARIPILMYHSVSGIEQSSRHAYYRTDTHPSTFADQMTLSARLRIPGHLLR